MDSNAALNTSTGPQSSADLDADTTRINIIFVLTSTMSVLGALTVMWSYVARKELRTASLHIVAVMAICDLGFATKFLGSALLCLFGNMDANTTGTFLCALSGHAGQFFALATVLWNGVISLNLFFLLYKPRKHKPGQWIRTYHCVVWSYCVLSMIILAGTKQIGFTEDGTCWIQGKRSAYRLLFYVPLCLAFLFAMFAVGFATYRLQASGRNTSDARTTRKVLSRKRASLVRIYLVTIIFVLVWTWSIVFRATAFSSENPPPMWLTYIQAFFLGSQGFFNAAAWSISVLLAPKPKDRKLAPTVVGMTAVAPTDADTTVARFQVIYPGEIGRPRESWEKDNPTVPQSSSPTLDETPNGDMPIVPVQDSVWRIAVRAAAGSPSLDLPSITGSSSQLYPPPRPHHARTPSSFYDFYDLVVFDGDHPYEQNEIELSAGRPSFAGSRHTADAAAVPETARETGRWRLGVGWSARREWAGHA
ncbi:slime mold cyclic AMP receptor-domain-containing protein [Powellomyces hirtus]|nr:slime mold cyclic AMP receptor-domain-containing protein [Powellomyces hirtus]